MKQAVIILSIVCCLGCQSKTNKLTFYIENISRVDTLINFNVYVGEDIKVDTVFEYSTVTPNYDIFVFEELMKDSIAIKVSTNTGAKNEFKIKFDKDAYVFLAYVHDSIITEKERISNQKMKKELNDFDPSVLLEKKAIREKVQYTEPILY